MGRLLVAAAWLVAASGCSGAIDNEGLDGLTPEQVTAQRLWVSKALPQLQTNCISCHDGSMPDTGFLAGAGDLEKRDTLMAYTPTPAAGVASVVDLGAPSLSLLLIKGAHDGPALDAAQSSDILEWVNAERAAAPDDEPGNRIETAPFLAALCISGLPDDPAAPNPNCPINKIALDSLGVAGAEIRFVVQNLSPGLYMTNLKLVPGAAGVFIDHPLFISLPADAEPKLDAIDRFASVKMNLMATATPAEQTIGDGTASFVDFPATDMLLIHFQAASVFKAE